MSAASEPDIAANLRQLMKRHKVNVRALARAVGIPYRTMQNYLSGESRVPAEVLFKIAGALTVEPEFLYYGNVYVDTDAMKYALDACLHQVLPHLSFEGDKAALRGTPPASNPKVAEALRDAVSKALAAQMTEFYVQHREMVLGSAWVFDMEASLKSRSARKKVVQ